MFPIDAIKKSRNYSLLADEFFDHLDLLLMDTGLEKLRDDIAIELVYHYLYQTNHVPEQRVLYSDVCEKLGNMINDYFGRQVIVDSEDLHPIITPALAELDIVFHLADISRWGVFTAEIKFNQLEIGYVGDFRILRWSQTDDAKRFHKGPTAEHLYQETRHGFQL